MTGAEYKTKELIKTINRIMKSYIRFFKVKNLNVQIVLADDMYEAQKNYGFVENTEKSLDEATARKNWKYVAACMKYPKKMSEPFTLIFKKPYLARSPIHELYRLVFHELTHIVDYRDYARLNNLASYEQLFKSNESVLFQHWSEYHAERRGYAAWLKHRYGIRMDIADGHGSQNKINIMHQETVSNIKYYGEHYTNTAEYGSSRQVYFTMHLLARMSIWHQMLPIQVSEILSKDPFDYKGVEWIKKLMVLFQKYPNIEQMNNHFFDIAVIVSENLKLSQEEIWEKVS